MSDESIHDIIAKSAHLGEEGALRSLLARPKIKAWINGDAEREKRLRDEFHRLWVEHHGDPAAAAAQGADGPRLGPGAPAPRTVATVVHHTPPPPPPPAPAPGRVREVEAAPVTRPEPRVREARAPAASARSGPVKGGRRESFMCASCGSVAIYSDWDGDSIKVSCHACKTVYPDMLKLIPVKEVGPIELLFGPGVMGYVKAGLLVLAPLAIYFLFRALR